uniref:3-oxoacyl-[acyl-carrier protein] reductase n=1 Tax=Candidatus Kentrum sp. MB TaxID=2138164 RepID=A0A451B9W6_9GAMM|nr:MAG: 3-oxoacyl-[acyl-carrier protein] reductase [Candidatus Kentron sp. MB]VFK27194.1 MAG: 3-oxoacyl-[acyl-carrier protein] reductase [Candidatus Kentron sp. MB]VFK75086.1 MAG: 3-oxoacyl-[acyl-carrier protein] reductase [Candidatus Kentron sp. MB]
MKVQSMKTWQEVTVDSLFDLRGRRALVTGGSRGIGKAIAKVLLRAGAEVVITGRTQEALNATQEEFLASFGKRIHTLSVDHAEWERSGKHIEQVERLLGGESIDVLVNNAGWYPPEHSLERIDDELWMRVHTLNLFTPMALTRAVVPAMKRKQWGRILNIASYLGLFGKKEKITYTTSKGGLVAFTKALAAELGPFGITVNAIAPGQIKTEAWTHPEKANLSFPMGRFGEPEEIAGLALALVADTGSYITGQIICVDGGASAV